MLLTWWVAISPAIVLEGKGVMESFGRSRELVRGNGWPVFTVVILTLLIGLAISIAVGIALFWLPEEAGGFLRGLVTGTLTAPFAALAWTLTYFRLSGLRTEPETAQIPAVVRGEAFALALDPKTEERIERPISSEAEREIRLTPSQAVAQMRIKVPTRGNRKLRTLVSRVNEDSQLKAWWHVANVNATARLEINDHSWVHVQIVSNIALKLLRQLTKHGVKPAMVADYGLDSNDAEVVVMLEALLHCIGMAVHRDGHEDFSLFLAEPKSAGAAGGHLRGARADGRRLARRSRGSPATGSTASR